MASLAFYFSATVLFAQSSVAFNCSIPPIYVDIHKRVTHFTDNFQYGSFVGVGTPAQNHSLWPSLSKNQTSFGASTFCEGNSTLRDCESSTGGFFNSRDSTSYVYISGLNLLITCLHPIQLYRGQELQDIRHCTQQHIQRFILWPGHSPLIHTLLRDRRRVADPAGQLFRGGGGRGLNIVHRTERSCR
jgi:hypothetical protein